MDVNTGKRYFKYTMIKRILIYNSIVQKLYFIVNFVRNKTERHVKYLILLLPERKINYVYEYY